jgi:type IV pilus assembly protein PilA
MKKQQSGFTLIELMIVVAIIGILAAIAIPSYMDYQKKAKVAEAPLALSPAKAAISEYYILKESWPTSSADAGFAVTTASDNFQNITYAGSSTGAVSVAAETDFATLTITLTPTAGADGGVKWDCTSTGADSRLAPASCR